ncbi:type VI secretion system-associated FHA domain protein TagH [Roseomonas xinghualingensis]|uniref:type VI secretion system-associated FHA domain protein TagH n=1 Tax=Roseomonas xinghualingensis TaxID=2986475 RepID=UPI00366AB919
MPGGEFTIGRGPNNDWVLPDPDRHLSKRHCQVAYRAGRWCLTDLSSNGTHVNHGAAPLGAGNEWTLRDGDRITLGAYEIEVRIEAEATSAPGTAYRSGGYGGQGGQVQMPSDERLSPGLLDPFAEPPAPHRPFGDRFESSAGGLTPERPGGPDDLRLPPDFDPLEGLDDPFAPSQPDHAPALNAAFSQPRATNLIPDDWDLEEPGGHADPWDAPSAAPAQQAPSPLPANATLDHEAASERVTAPGAIPGPGPAADRAIAAFLRGTGLGETALPEPEATMEQAGAALRAAVSGLRQAMIARASIKGEFRIEQTMIQSRGNNPLKFSAGDEDAMAALLGIGRRTGMAPEVAMADALRDLRLHELATVTAMQAAVRALLASFAPAGIEREVEKGGFSMLPGGRKARAWEAFEAMHAEVSAALADDFDSVFGKSFARAYEQAMDELLSRKDG